MQHKSKKKSKDFFGKLGYRKDVIMMNLNAWGPQRQIVYVLRFPVTYKNVKLVSRKVDFTNYFDWMGQLRELSFEPIMGKILSLTAQKDWGLATNTVSLRVFDLLNGNDVLESRMWLEKITGLNNIYHICFDWLRFLGKGSYERVAQGKIIITCVKIISHGKAAIVKPPNFVKNFFKDMEPKSTHKQPLKEYSAALLGVGIGKKIKEFKQEPPALFQNIFQTTLENSNLIGNVYFANYAKWINSTKDLFLYKNCPILFNSFKFPGEFITLECDICHKQEAMPFDRVLVKMFVSKIHERSLVLEYRIFKVGGVGELATAKQKILFVNCKPSKIVPRSIPAEILKIFI